MSIDLNEHIIDPLRKIKGDKCLWCEHYKDYGGNVGRCIKNRTLVSGDSWCSAGNPVSK